MVYVTWIAWKEAYEPIVELTPEELRGVASALLATVTSNGFLVSAFMALTTIVDALRTEYLKDDDILRVLSVSIEQFHMLCC